MRDRVRLGTVTITEEERELVNRVLNKGYVSPGEVTKQFEQEIAETHGKKYAIALNSGQSAIMVALEASAKLRDITHVAVPAITYISSIAAIIQAGLKPILVDVEPTPNAEMKWEEIPSHAQAVLPCHLFGRANTNVTVNVQFVCEDACESIYAEGIGIGHVTCLSFYPSHTITAGIGGMILTDDKDLYFKCWQLVNHGRADWDNYDTCHTLKERFTFSDIGYSLKFSDLNAALGLAQHKNREYILMTRRNNAKTILSGLSNIDGVTLPSAEKHTFMMFPILAHDGRRDALETALNNEEIETRRMMPITTQPVIQRMYGPHVTHAYPGAQFINDNGLYIGCHQGMTDEHLDRIIDTIQKFYK